MKSEAAEKRLRDEMTEKRRFELEKRDVKREDPSYWGTARSNITSSYAIS